MPEFPIYYHDDYPKGECAFYYALPCEGHPITENTNQKEANTMNNTTINTKCQAIKKDGDRCSHEGQEMLVFHLAGVVYPLDGLPISRQDTGFMKEVFRFCGSHANLLRAGKDLRAVRNIEIPNQKGNAMTNVPSHDHNGKLVEDPIDFLLSDANQFNNACVLADDECFGNIINQRCRRHADEALPTKEHEYDDEDYDYEHSFEVQLARLEGRPYTKHTLPHGSHILVENCDCCEDIHTEYLYEAAGEFCCDNRFCEHYNAWLCQNHTPLPVKQIRCGHCKESHPTVEEVRACHGVEAKQPSHKGYKWFNPDQKAESLKYAKDTDGTHRTKRSDKNVIQGYMVFLPKSESTTNS